MTRLELFLTEEEVAILTGIGTGRGGKSRGQRQAEILRVMGVPFYFNAIKRPIIVRAVLEGRSASPAPEKVKWVPQVLLEIPGRPE